MLFEQFEQGQPSQLPTVPRLLQTCRADASPNSISSFEDAAPAPCATLAGLGVGLQRPQEVVTDINGVELPVTQAGVERRTVDAANDVGAVTAIELQNAAETFADAGRRVGYSRGGILDVLGLTGNGHPLQSSGQLGTEVAARNPGAPVGNRANLEQVAGEAGLGEVDGPTCCV